VHEHAELSFSKAPSAVQSQREALDASLVPSASAKLAVPQGDWRRAPSHEVDIPDDVFESFFGDWHAPPTKAVHKHVELSFSEGQQKQRSAMEGMLASARATLGASSGQARRENEHKWGKLGRVDDIFAELNSIDAGVSCHRGGA